MRICVPPPSTSIFRSWSPSMAARSGLSRDRWSPISLASRSAATNCPFSAYAGAIPGQCTPKCHFFANGTLPGIRGCLRASSEIIVPAASYRCYAISSRKLAGGLARLPTARSIATMHDKACGMHRRRPSDTSQDLGMAKRPAAPLESQSRLRTVRRRNSRVHP